MDTYSRHLEETIELIDADISLEPTSCSFSRTIVRKCTATSGKGKESLLPQLQDLPTDIEIGATGKNYAEHGKTQENISGQQQGIKCHKRSNPDETNDEVQLL